jgi:uncharacterized SAM-binding protein YcdF (DUF218 family)
MKTSRKFKIIVTLLLAFLAWMFLAWYLAERLIVEKPLERADAILILGGSSVYVERTEKAAELYKKGVANRILLSDDGERAGWSRLEKRNTPFVELAKKNLIQQGVAPENIEILEPQVTGTIYEAQNLKKKLEGTNWKSILIITSAYHTRRALWTFERVLPDGNTEIGIESPPAGQQTPKPFYWWLSPFGWNVVAGEYVKSAYYWVYY